MSDFPLTSRKTQSFPASLSANIVLPRQLRRGSAQLSARSAEKTTVVSCTEGWPPELPASKVTPAVDPTAPNPPTPPRQRRRRRYGMAWTCPDRNGARPPPPAGSAPRSSAERRQRSGGGGPNCCPTPPLPPPPPGGRSQPRRGRRGGGEFGPIGRPPHHE